MSEKYSAEWVREQAAERGATWLTSHDCSLCGLDVGYVIDGDRVAFRSGCGCSWSPDRPSGFGDISNWLAMQKTDAIRDKIMGRLK